MNESGVDVRPSLPRTPGSAGSSPVSNSDVQMQQPPNMRSLSVRFIDYSSSPVLLFGDHVCNVCLFDLARGSLYPCRVSLGCPGTRRLS